MSNLTYDVKDKALSMGADLVGIASVDRYEHAPIEGQPQYYMPDAKAVVVIATRILEGICDVHGSYEEEGKTIIPYFWHGYSQLNWANSWIAIQVGKLLENNGYRAIPFPPAGMYYRDAEHSIPEFYHKHSAVAAGLGEFGHSTLLLTPQFGAHQRLISLITSAPLQADPMYSGPKLCRRDECGDFCMKACSLQAIGDKVFTGKIGDKIFEYAMFNSARCMFQSIGGRYMRGKTRFSERPTDAELEKYRREFNAQSRGKRMNHYDAALSLHTFGPACGECLTKCPAPFK